MFVLGYSIVTDTLFFTDHYAAIMAGGRDQNYIFFEVEINQL
jgi:hypothetical protein